MKAIDRTGQKFNRLTLIKKIPNGKHTKYLCLCDCGNTKEIRANHIVSGASSSCGCYNSEVASKRIITLHKEGRIKPPTTHGMTHSTEYHSWNGMKARCTNINNPNYYNWGGRGITVCDRWFNSFENFFKDMGVKPSSKHSIDRIDNNGNYEPSNCRWADHETQCSNTRANVFLSFNGDKKTVTQWANYLNVNSSALAWRLKNGWSIEKTLTTPMERS